MQLFGDTAGGGTSEGGTISLGNVSVPLSEGWRFGYAQLTSANYCTAYSYNEVGNRYYITHTDGQNVQIKAIKYIYYSLSLSVTPAPTVSIAYSSGAINNNSFGPGTGVLKNILTNTTANTSINSINATAIEIIQIFTPTYSFSWAGGQYFDFKTSNIGADKLFIQFIYKSG